jgi:MFS family permease
VLTSAYLLSFSLFQLPLGVFLDRYGARRVQTVLLGIAAAGCFLFAVAPDFLSLVASRAIIGLGFSAGLMASFKASSIWVPIERRSSPMPASCRRAPLVLSWQQSPRPSW